jgi:hypothetical protein
MQSLRGLARSFGWSLVAIGVVVSMVLSQVGVADAQDGPQFGNWGPGIAPPDEEGADAPRSPSSSGTENYGAPGASGREAAPSAAAAPGFVGGCSYDLRGTWWNDGRMTTGSRQSYSASVTVRQYRSWIQAEQDDGTSYYGRCVGNRLTFDVYSGYQFAGTQSGTITAPASGSGNGLSRSSRGGFWAEPAYEAAAAPAPSTGSARARFNWNTWYGSGNETWTR